MSKQKKLALCGVLLCVNILFIWGNSMMPAAASEQISGGAMAWLGWIVSAFGDLGENVLRKLAHFTEFACLGLLLAWLFRLLEQKSPSCFTMALFCGTLTACVDETIQIFVPGRSSSLIDVWIDFAGVCVGILLLHFGYFFYQKKKTKPTLEEN